MSTVDSNVGAFPWERPSSSDFPIPGGFKPEMEPRCYGFDDISDQIQQIRGELLKEHRDFVKPKNSGSLKSLEDRTERRRQLLDLSCSLRNQQNKANRNNLEEIARKLTILKEKPPMAPKKEPVRSEKGTSLKAHKGGHLGRLLGLATKLRSQSEEYLREKYADDGTAPTECSSVSTASRIVLKSHEPVDVTPKSKIPLSDCIPCSPESSMTVSQLCKMFDRKATKPSTIPALRHSNLFTTSEGKGSSEEEHISKVDVEHSDDPTNLKPASLTSQNVIGSVLQLNTSHPEPLTELLQQEEGENEEKYYSERRENYGGSVTDNFNNQVLEALGEILQLQSIPRPTANDIADTGSQEYQAPWSTQNSTHRRRRTRSGLHPSKRKSKVPPNPTDMDESTCVGAYRITSPHQNLPVYRSRRHFQKVRNSELLAQHPIPKRRLRQQQMDHSERRRVLTNTKEQIVALIERCEVKNDEHLIVSTSRVGKYLDSPHQADESSCSIVLDGSTCSEFSDDEPRASTFLGLCPTFSESEDETM